MQNHQSQNMTTHDISIIRPQMKQTDFEIRGRDLAPERLENIKKGLRTLHTLELMAFTIYRFQIGMEASELNCQLTAAMCNEMTHYQDFQIKLYEYGFRPAITRWIYWLLGFIVGYSSRLLGKKAILKTGIWVETKAVHHYSKLLNTVDWDDKTRKIVEKDQADEDGHITRWKAWLRDEKD